MGKYIGKNKNAYLLGISQLEQWHETKRIRDNQAKIEENKKILAWAKATAEQRLIETGLIDSQTAKDVRKLQRKRLQYRLNVQKMLDKKGFSSIKDYKDHLSKRRNATNATERNKK